MVSKTARKKKSALRGVRMGVTSLKRMALLLERDELGVLRDRPVGVLLFVPFPFPFPP